LHAHVLIWRGFGLCAEAESAHPLQQLPLSRGPIGREPDLASWLVEIPNRDRERSASLFRNADDSHVKIGEKPLAFLLRHRQRHSTLSLNSPPRSSTPLAQTPASEALEIRQSITWSARTSNDCGIASPSAFAVFKLMTSSNFV